MTLAALGVSLTVLLGFAALAVDVANGYVVRGILQHAVDDATITAQRWSAQVDDPGVDSAAVLAAAVSAAVAAARRDVQAHGLATVTAVDAAVAGSRLRVGARASVRTWFLRAFGVESLTPSASSDVVLWTAASGAASPPAVPGPGVAPAPTFPTAAGPVPLLMFPDGPAGPSVQQGDAAPAPGPPSGAAGDPAGPPSGDPPAGGGGGIYESGD